jgi:hypothetical protein
VIAYITPFVSHLANPPACRKRIATDCLIGEPSGAVKLKAEMQLGAKQNKRQKQISRKEAFADQVKGDIKSTFSRKEIGKLIFPDLTTHLTHTKEGRASVAKYLVGDNTIQLPGNGKSKSAKVKQESQVRKLHKV